METVTDLNAFKVIYQDEHLVAIHKPAGLLMHRSPIDRHETRFAVQMTRDAIDRHVYTIHRLDKATSGLVLFALDSDTARIMGEQFSQHRIQKQYLAIVRGWAQPSGIIDHALKPKLDKIADKMRRQDKPPQSAITDYQRLGTTEIEHPVGRYPTARYSLLTLSPQTGRKHQLRRHLNHISHPIIGDVNYGDRHHNHFFNQWLGQHRLYLAATDLSFTHPLTGRETTLSAPLEPSFIHALKRLSLEPDCDRCASLLRSF